MIFFPPPQTAVPTQNSVITLQAFSIGEAQQTSKWTDQFPSIQGIFNDKTNRCASYRH